jgi:hypothetical protein
MDYISFVGRLLKDTNVMNKLLGKDAVAYFTPFFYSFEEIRWFYETLDEHYSNVLLYS